MLKAEAKLITSIHLPTPGLQLLMVNLNIAEMLLSTRRLPSRCPDVTVHLLHRALSSFVGHEPNFTPLRLVPFALQSSRTIQVKRTSFSFTAMFFYLLAI